MLYIPILIVLIMFSFAFAAQVFINTRLIAHGEMPSVGQEIRMFGYGSVAVLLYLAFLAQFP